MKSKIYGKVLRGVVKGRIGSEFRILDIEELKTMDVTQDGTKIHFGYDSEFEFITEMEVTNELTLYDWIYLNGDKHSINNILFDKADNCYDIYTNLIIRIEDPDKELFLELCRKMKDYHMHKGNANKVKIFDKIIQDRQKEGEI